MSCVCRQSRLLKDENVGQSKCMGTTLKLRKKICYKNGRETDDMPLYIQTPAISTYIGPDQMWCQRFPCRTNYNLASILYLPQTNQFLAILVFQDVSLCCWLTLNNEGNMFLPKIRNHLSSDTASHPRRIKSSITPLKNLKTRKSVSFSLPCPMSIRQTWSKMYLYNVYRNNVDGIDTDSNMSHLPQSESMINKNHWSKQQKH